MVWGPARIRTLRPPMSLSAASRGPLGRVGLGLGGSQPSRSASELHSLRGVLGVPSPRIYSRVPSRRQIFVLWICSTTEVCSPYHLTVFAFWRPHLCPWQPLAAPSSSTNARRPMVRKSSQGDPASVPTHKKLKSRDRGVLSVLSHAMKRVRACEFLPLHFCKRSMALFTRSSANCFSVTRYCFRPSAST